MNETFPTSAGPSEPVSSEAFLLEVADAVNATLDLDTLLQRIASLVRRSIPYEIFAILLLNEQTREMRIRFQVGHPPEVAQRIRVKIGEGITGLAAAKGEAILINDVSRHPEFISSGAGARSELAIPLIANGKVIGVIDIEAPQTDYFTEEHRNILTLVASRIAVAVENARLYTRVVRQADTLALLNNISRDLTSILDLDQLFKRIGEALARLMEYQMFSILLLNESKTSLEHRFSLRFNENVHIKHDIPLDRGLVGYAAAHNEVVLVSDVARDERYIKTNPETQSELCVPLVYKDKVIGVLDLEHTRAYYFTEEHVRTLSTLAGQIAIAIENATLYEHVSKQEARLEQDMHLARELQHRLLPPCCPLLRKAELGARFTPARAIGGDLYDYLTYDGGKVTAIAIGDVSGKGAPAAIYAALVSGVLLSLAPEQPSPAEMLSGINLSLAERPIPGQFISMIYAVWDERDMSLRIANSGLPRPVRCSGGKIEVIDATGLPGGLFPKADYDECTFHALPGDIFVFFSDGIPDATNANGEQFGYNRLHHVIEQNSQVSADELVTAIFDAVNDFVGGVEAFDDQTVVALRVKDSRNIE